MVFKMAAVRHVGFVKIKFFNGWRDKRPILHQRTKFSKDRSNRCGYIAIFVIFKMAAAAILDFQKFKILTVDPLLGADMRHHAKFHQNRWNGRRDMAIKGFFQNGGRPLSWICWAPTGTIHQDHLVVSIVVPNLVKINAVLSIT